MRRMLGSAGRFMFESLEAFLDEPGHGAGDKAVGVVPVKTDSTEEFATPIGGDVICFLKCFNEKIDVAFVGVFDTEVVDDEAECDGASFVGEESGSVWSWDKIGVCQVAD